jgi:hypothetical protein
MPLLGHVLILLGQLRGKMDTDKVFFLILIVFILVSSVAVSYHKRKTQQHLNPLVTKGMLAYELIALISIGYFFLLTSEKSSSITYIIFFLFVLVAIIIVTIVMVLILFLRARKKRSHI